MFIVSLKAQLFFLILRYLKDGHFGDCCEMGIKHLSPGNHETLCVILGKGNDINEEVDENTIFIFSYSSVIKTSFHSHLSVVYCKQP